MAFSIKNLHIHCILWICFSIIGLSFTIVSCENKSKEVLALQEQLLVAKQSLPVNMGTLGSFTDIIYRNDTITFVYEVTDETVSYMEVAGKDNVIKDNFWLAASINNNTQKMINDIANADACLVIQYNHNGKWYYKMTFPNQILQKSDQYLLTSTEASSKLLQNDITVMNKLYPQAIEEGMTMNKVYIEDDKLIYEILLDSRYFDFSNISESDKEQMKLNLKEELSSDSDPTTKKFARILLTLNMQLCYRYKSKNSTVDIIMKTSELRSIIR